MSYDIRFAVKVADAPDDCYAVIGAPEYDSPTYNIREIFVQSMDWNYHQGEWYKIKEVLPNIKRGVNELTFKANKYKHLEPENGWGSVESARQCLQSILDYFSDSFDGIGGTWNADIPYDCIYMRW